jgi:tetratricopeptide (TPR) repeat protein
MNQRHGTHFQRAQNAAIKWRGKKWPLGEASALAVREQSLGNFEAAAEIFGLLLALMPDSAELHNNRGVMLQMVNRYAEALACYDRAVALKPDYAIAHFNRGYSLNKLNRPEEALAGYDHAIALKPDLANAHNNRGVVLQALRRYDDAVASYRQALVVNPGHAEACNNLGTALLNRGNLSEAEKVFRHALELKADFSDPLYNLVSMRKYQDADNAEAGNIRALLEKAGILAGDKEYLNFALGKIYDDCGRYDEAFECYRQANEIRNSMVAYNPDAVRKMTDDIMDVFSADFLAKPFPFASASRAPVFIVGMPRSGTTLFASVLSNHRDIAMAGELSTLGDLAGKLKEWTGGPAAYPQAVRRLKPSVAERVIAAYVQRLRRDVGPDVPFVIDKNPLNFRHLGMITMLFPRARIIHCLRNPLDTCLSNYFQRFPLNLDYCFDLRNIGHFYGEYARLMEHWRKIPALNLLEVRYEDMVSNTEPAARKILDFIGLDWDERCLTPHTNPNPVETASLWQVRQPIYSHALERWRHYEKHLGPLKEMLAAAGLTPA